MWAHTVRHIGRPRHVPLHVSTEQHGPVPHDEVSALGWWAISGEQLLGMLRLVAAGEDPDLVYAEEYAGSGHEYPPGTDAR